MRLTPGVVPLATGLAKTNSLLQRREAPTRRLTYAASLAPLGVLHWRLIILLSCCSRVLRGEEPPAEQAVPPATVKAPARPAARTNNYPQDAFVFRRWEMLPTVVNVNARPVWFPRDEPCFAVDQLVWLERKLWVAARPRGITPTNWTTARLYAFSPEANRMESVKGVLEHYHPRALAGVGTELWMSVEGGVALYNPKTSVVDGFNAYQGITSSNVVGFAEIGEKVVALSEGGTVFSLDRTETNFVRLGSPAVPINNTRSPEPWRQLASSAGWLAILGTNEVVFRHALSGEWQPSSHALLSGSPRLERTTFRAIVGDGTGGFWIGSDAGLHRLLAETGGAQNALVPPGVVVPAPRRPKNLLAANANNPGLLSAARIRMASAISARMRDRARYARMTAEANRAIDPVTPRTRLPGAVLSLARDKDLLWVATTDGLNTAASRILLKHLPSQKWIGWFPVNAPVRVLEVNDRWLWVGLDTSFIPQASPLLLVDKSPIISVPSNRWLSDDIAPQEIELRLKALPLKERAIYAFFSGDSQKVVELLTPLLGEADDESLFVMAFAHDEFGLQRRDQLLEYVGELQTRFPGSPFSISATNLVRPTPGRQ